MPPTSVHFNGSVNLPDAETVMREISSRIPVGVRRMTDGETGERGYWIMFQIQKFMQMPEFESVAVGQAYETSPDAPEMTQLGRDVPWGILNASVILLSLPPLLFLGVLSSFLSSALKTRNQG